ncbi:MAG: hypothetical protein WCI36_03835 [bacterium]
MPTIKTTKTKRKDAGTGSDWKSLVQGFVGNVLEQMSENVSHKIHAWLKVLKRKTIGAVMMFFGLAYLLIGLSMYLNSILAKILPGLGYVTVGILAVLIGVLISSDEVK